MKTVFQTLLLAVLLGLSTGCSKYSKSDSLEKTQSRQAAAQSDTTKKDKTQKDKTKAEASKPSQVNQTVAIPSDAKTVLLNIEGMMCAESCAPAAQKILSKQPGVYTAKVDYETKTATCQIDEKLFDLKLAIEALDDEDFKATLKTDAVAE